jgi:hypothetical protein
MSFAMVALRLLCSTATSLCAGLQQRVRMQNFPTMICINASTNERKTV